MRIRWMIVAVSSALLATGAAVAQRGVPTTAKPVPMAPAPVLPTVNPPVLTPSLPLTPAPNLHPLPSPALVPVGLCSGANPPPACTEKPLPESGGDDNSFSDLCEATPRPAWCEDPAKPPKLTVNN